MFKNALPVTLSCVFLMTLSCQPPAEDTVSSMEEDLTAIRAQTTAFAEAIKILDFDAAAATMSEDVVIMGPNQSTIVGRQGWLDFAGASGITEITRYSIEIDEIEVQGNLGFVRLTFDEAFAVEGMDEPFSDQGKGVQIWRKEADGTWRFAVDCWNSNLPLPSSEGAE